MSVTVSSHKALFSYIEVLKPRETILLLFIGGCSAVIAAGGYPAAYPFILSLTAIGLGSAGCNGLTNYLDREVDGRMARTRNRALPSRRITPPQKVLPLVASLIGLALILAWLINPLCLLFGVIGVIASATWRKTVSCVCLGTVSSCVPVLIGWFALNPQINLQILSLCLLVAVWIPVHVWSVMMANREDYLAAGLTYFPLSWQTKDTVKILFGLSLLLYFTSILIFLVGYFSLFYLVAANIMGILMVYANIRLLLSPTTLAAWQVHKLSAFPYLGIIFLAMCVDIWLV